MTDIHFYDFVRGSLLQFAIYFFFVGLAYRLIRVLLLGLPGDFTKPKGNPLVKATEKIIFKPSQSWRFFREVFAHRGVQYIGGFLFHIGFLGLTFFVPQHAFLWKQIIGIEFPHVPQIVADLLAYAAIGSLFVLTIHRMLNPVLKLLTGKDEYFANFLIGMVLFTGLLATRWSGGSSYIWILNIHMLSAVILIIYIPFSRLSHFIYYFVSIFFYGWNVGKRGISF